MRSLQYFCAFSLKRVISVKATEKLNSYTENVEFSHSEKENWGIGQKKKKMYEELRKRGDRKWWLDAYMLFYRAFVYILFTNGKTCVVGGNTFFVVASAFSSLFFFCFFILLFCLLQKLCSAYINNMVYLFDCAL